MRVIIAGFVMAEDFEMADMFGIVPTSFVTNGLSAPPGEMGLTCEACPPDKMLGDLAHANRNRTMCVHADALVIQKGFDDHLVQCARDMNLPVLEV